VVPEVLDVFSKLTFGVGTEREPDRRGEVRPFRPACCLPRLDDTLALRSQRLGVEVQRMRRVAHADSPLRDSSERLGADHSGDERDATRLYRCGPHRKVSLEGRFLGPHTAHRSHDLVHALTLSIKRASNGEVVLIPRADADPECQAPVGQDVYGRQVFREQDRVAHRERDDVGPEPYALRHRRRGGELRDNRPAVGVDQPFVGGEGRPTALRRSCGTTQVPFRDRAGRGWEDPS